LLQLPLPVSFTRARVETSKTKEGQLCLPTMEERGERSEKGGREESGREEKEEKKRKKRKRKEKRKRKRSARV